jgi:hypothetical protein
MTMRNEDQRLQRSDTFRFETRVGGDLRTCGIAVAQVDRLATDFGGLDLEKLGRAAIGRDGASACGKIVIVGRDGALVLQARPAAVPELVWCGNAAAPIGVLPTSNGRDVKLLGPAGQSAVCSFSTAGGEVHQFWTIASPTVSEDQWRGRTVLRCRALNDYAVVLDSLPPDVTPEEARRALVGTAAGAKLAVIARQCDGPPSVAFYNACGPHGAAPMTGLATLAIMAHSSSLASLVIDRVSFVTKSGTVVVPLPAVDINPGGSVTVSMPAVDVVLSPTLHQGLR